MFLARPTCGFQNNRLPCSSMVVLSMAMRIVLCTEKWLAKVERNQSRDTRPDPLDGERRESRGGMRVCAAQG